MSFYNPAPVSILYREGNHYYTFSKQIETLCLGELSNQYPPVPGFAQHQPLEPIISAQSVESSNENSVMRDDDSRRSSSSGAER